MGAVQNLVGQTFNRLTVKRLLSVNPVVWECECICGVVLPVMYTHSLKSGNTKSCGCLQREKAGSIKKQRPYEALYRRFKDCVRRHGRRKSVPTVTPISLTYEDFLGFTSVTECHYCGAEISWSEYNTNVNGAAYNLDRKDNSKGYEIGNVVVCCKRCNYGKADRFTYEEWVEMTRYFKFSRSNSTRLEAAVRLATYAHAGQIDEDGCPHLQHSLEVMFAVKRDFESREENIPYINGEDYSLEELMIAAVLHDVIEDTSLTHEDIVRDFGTKIAGIVDGVTRRHGDPLCKLANCQEHSKETYRDFIYRSAKSPAAKIIKVADLGVNRRRTSTLPESKAKWRNKLEYKYDIALRVLLAEVETSWEEASWEWEATKEEIAAVDKYPLMGHAKGRYFVADPNGKRVEITEDQFYDEYKLAKRVGA